MNYFLIYQIGVINRPVQLKRFGDVQTGAIGTFLQFVFNLLIIGGGIYAVFNFILAGYGFLSAGNDPKKIQSAWAKIWQTAIGLTFMAASFLLAAIFGRLIFGDATSLLTPSIPTL